MQILDGDRLLLALENEIKANECERDSAVISGHFETASKLDIINQGLKRAVIFINKGDFHLKESSFK